MHSTTFRPLFDHLSFLHKKIELKSSTKIQNGAIVEDIYNYIIVFYDIIFIRGVDYEFKR